MRKRASGKRVIYKPFVLSSNNPVAGRLDTIKFMPRFSIDENSSSSEDDGIQIPKRPRVHFPSRVLYRHGNSSNTPALFRQGTSGTTPSTAGASTSQPNSDDSLLESLGESNSEEEDDDEEDDDDDEDISPQKPAVPAGGLSIRGSSPRNLVNSLSNDVAASGSKDEEGRTSSPASAILTDTDVLDCAICFEPFTIPVYQCDNGHTACSSCCGKLRNKCPSCCAPIGYNRCRGLEKVLEAVKITCVNSKYGCGEKVSYSMKREHERSCAYEACYCPVTGCSFDGSYKDLYLHFACKHAASATRFTFDSCFPVRIGANMKYKFLQGNDHTLFVLNYGVQTIGNVANIICIGPSSLQKKYSYELEAHNVESSVKLTSLTQSQPKWTVGLPHNAVLLIPKVLIDSSGVHTIQVCIRRKVEK